MSFEETIARAVELAVEKVLREREPALVAAIAERLGKSSSEGLRSVEEAAVEVGIGEATIRTMVKERRVRAYRTPGGAKRGGRMRVDVAEVKRAMLPAGAPVPVRRSYPTNVIPRGAKLYIKVRMPDGRWKQAATGLGLDQGDAAGELQRRTQVIANTKAVIIDRRYGGSASGKRSG